MLGIPEGHRPAARKWAKRIGLAISVVVLLWGAVQWVLRYEVGRNDVPESEAVLKKMGDGALRYYSRHCEFPPPIQSHKVEATIGGEKLIGDWAEGANRHLNDHYQVTFEDPMYFVYSSHPFMDGEAMRIEARADLEPGGEHTVVWVILAKTGECTAERVQQSLNVSHE